MWPSSVVDSQDVSVSAPVCCDGLFVMRESLPDAGTGLRFREPPTILCTLLLLRLSPSLSRSWIVLNEEREKCGHSAMTLGDGCKESLDGAFCSRRRGVERCCGPLGEDSLLRAFETLSRTFGPRGVDRDCVRGCIRFAANERDDTIMAVNLALMSSTPEWGLQGMLYGLPTSL